MIQSIANRFARPFDMWTDDNRGRYDRNVVNGLMYILSTGCQWRALPRDFPPRSTVNDYFRRWTEDGTLDRIHHGLYVAVPGTGRSAGQPDRRDYRQPKREKRGKRRRFDRSARL